MIKFNSSTFPQQARQDWAILGVSLAEDDVFVPEWHTTHVKLKTKEPYVLKKGYNLIELPELNVKEAVVIMDLAQELLTVAQNVKTKGVFSFTAKPQIGVFCKEETTITNICELYLVKGAFR